MQILGIGTNGHIGFNEPAPALQARTHRVALEAGDAAQPTRVVRRRSGAVPARSAVDGDGDDSSGARRSCCWRPGTAKAACVERLLNGPITTDVAGLVPAAARRRRRRCSTRRRRSRRRRAVSRLRIACSSSPQARLEIFADRLAHGVVGLLQSPERLRQRQPRLLHHDRGLDVPLRALAAARRRRRRSRPVTHDDDAAGAILQLLGSGLHVDHQVAVGLADLDHRDRGQHVEHHLGRGAGLEARRAGDELGADRRRDLQVDEVLQLGARPAGDEDDLGAGLARRGSGRRARTASCRSPRRR